jgi:hypothetical protein
MTEPSKKPSLKKLADQIQVRSTDQHILRETARDLIGQVKSLITMNQPLPTAELSRYLTMVCLSGIHDSHGTEQRDWVRIMTSVLRTETAARKLDSDDEGSIERRIEQVEKIVQAADNYTRFTDVELEDEDDSPGNGRPRPQEG